MCSRESIYASPASTEALMLVLSQILHERCLWNCLTITFVGLNIFTPPSPAQWGAANAEIKVCSPFKAWSRPVYSHTCSAYCQGFLPCLFLPFRSIYLHFFQNLSQFFLCWLWLTHGSCVGPQNKIGHPAGGRCPCWVPAEYKKV